MNVELDRDVFLGFAVQNAIPPGSRLRKQVDRRIEQLVQIDDKKPINLAVVLHVLEACRQQLQHEGDDDGGLNKGMTALSLRADQDGSDEFFPEICYPVEEYLSQVDETKWDRVVINYASKAAKCWNCGLNGHIRRNCPNKLTPWNRPVGNTYSRCLPACEWYQPSLACRHGHWCASEQ